jgi:hypothetical protein
MPDYPSLDLDSTIRQLGASATGWWRKGPSISFNDLKNGTGNVEHITSAKFFNTSDPEESRGEALITFGKFKGKPLSWVKENERNYWDWCRGNLDWFDKKVSKLGM